MCESVALEPGADDDVDRLGAQPPHHPQHVVDLVLAVRVEGDEEPRTRLPPRVLDPGLDGGALPEVDRMPDQPRSGARDLRGGAVAAAVIDADDVRERLQRVADDGGDHRRLVVDRDHQPDIGIRGARIRLDRIGHNATRALIIAITPSPAKNTPPTRRRKPVAMAATTNGIIENP